MTMYLDHFGLREAPFKITPHTEFFFAGANRGATLDALIYAITAGEGIVKVVGEVGSGKTMLCRVLMERLPKTVETIYLAVPSLTRDEMIVVVAGDLGIETQGVNTTRILRALQEKLIQIHAEGRQVVALIDEAHAMPLATLEEIRLLSNLETNQDKLMQIVLFGQPELDEHLSLPNMRQLKERITHAFSLMPLPPRDIRDYLSFRLRAAGYKGPDLFGAEAIKLIAEGSEGLTRRINIYADKTLLAAFAAGTHTIKADHVRAAISDTQITLPRDKAKHRAYAALAAGMIGGLALGFLAGRFTAPDSAMRAAIPAQAMQAATASARVAAASTPAPAAIPAAPADRKTDKAAQTGLTTGSNAEEAQAPRARPANPPAQAAPIPATPPDPQNWLANWLDARLGSDRARLNSAKTDHWSIQLMTADQRERIAIENYLKEAQRVLKTDDIFLYRSGSKDIPRVSVTYGDFPNRNEAQAALTRLPQALGQFRPYLRSFNAIREDLKSGAS
jgi:MSHA biogenesis protein MshM